MYREPEPGDRMPDFSLLSHNLALSARPPSFIPPSPQPFYLLPISSSSIPLPPRLQPAFIPLPSRFCPGFSPLFRLPIPQLPHPPTLTTWPRTFFPRSIDQVIAAALLFLPGSEWRDPGATLGRLWQRFGGALAALFPAPFLQPSPQPANPSAFAFIPLKPAPHKLSFFTRRSPSNLRAASPSPINWQLANWQLATGNWHLITGN